MVASERIFRGLQDFQSLVPLEQFKFDLLVRSWIMRIEMGRMAQGRNVSPQGSGPHGESTVLTGSLIGFLIRRVLVSGGNLQISQVFRKVRLPILTTT